MGMAASQARLLSITARLSNNEMEQQSVAYSKQRLANNSEQINDAYLEALKKTQYHVLTGYNGTEACYEELTYNQITGLSSVATGKQYLVKDNKGQVLVSAQIAAAFKDNNGDFNRFLRDLGYTQSDIDVTDFVTSEEAIHDAWDKYLVSVGKSLDKMDPNDPRDTNNINECEHILGFDYESFSADSYDGYPTYSVAYGSAAGGTISLYKDSQGYYTERNLVQAIATVNETTDEVEYLVAYQKPENVGTDQWEELTDVTYNRQTKTFTFTDDAGNEVETSVLYADEDAAGNARLSESPRNYLTLVGGNNYVDEGGRAFTVNKENKALNFEGTTTAQRELYDYATAITEAYYNNKVSQTSQNLKYDKSIVDYYKNIFNEMRAYGYTTIENETRFKENEWFVRQLKAGNLRLSYYSTADKAFVATTLDDDESITEREDNSAMAIAEQVYHTEMSRIQSQDKQFDLQLNKLEAEHNALQTEYDSVKGVISKNVEKTFNIFNA